MVTLISEWGSIGKDTLTRDQSKILIRRGINKRFASVYAEETQSFPGSTKIRQTIQYKLFCFQDLLRILPKALHFSDGRIYRFRMNYEYIDNVQRFKGEWVVGYFGDQTKPIIRHSEELIDALYEIIHECLSRNIINPYELEEELL